MNDMSRVIGTDEAAGGGDDGQVFEVKALSFMTQSTRAPCAAAIAALKPATPPPITRTSVS